MTTPFRLIPESEVDASSLQSYLVPDTDAPPDGPLLVVGSYRILPELYLQLSAPHPATRRMSDTEFVALREFVRSSWIVDDIWFDPTGRVIDGYHRLRAACELILDDQPAAPVPHRFVVFHDPIEELRWVSARYVGGRELTKGDKRRLVEYLLLNGDNRADAAIAEETKLHRETVREVRQRLELSGKIEFLPVRYDRRGYAHEQQPPAKPSEAHVAKSKGASKESEREHLHIQGKNLMAPASAEEKEALLDLAVCSKAPTAGVDRAKRFLPCVAPEWWSRYGTDPITATMLLNLVREQELECDENDVRAIGHIVSALDTTRRTIGRFNILSYQYQGMSVRLYALRPVSWTRHGSGDPGDSRNA